MEATGKTVSGAVMTDVFLLPFGGGDWEGPGRERLPRWTASITLPLEEVGRGSPFPMSLLTSVSPLPSHFTICTDSTFLLPWE